ncbi:MAG: L-histidine N(alpha)-methyltransferase [Burkholderiaceae bacterium]
MNKENLPTSQSEGILLKGSSVLKSIASCRQAVHLIDVGGGDGLRALNIAENLIRQGTPVRYTCIDGSPSMLEMNRNNFFSTGISWSERCIRFEEFRDTDLDRRPSEVQLVLFLGNNYGNFSVEDVAEILSHPDLTSNDLVIIGTDTYRSSIDGDFVMNEFEKYSDDRMRMAVLSKLGLRRDELLDLYQYDRTRCQIEVYSLIKSTPANVAAGLNIEKGDILGQRRAATTDRNP